MTSAKLQNYMRELEQQVKENQLKKMKALEQEKQPAFTATI